jgi:signal transduction histidine kinase
MEKDDIIKQQLLLQNVLISISTKYINADLSNIDNLVTKSLKQIGESVSADRSYIFSYDFTANTTSNTYEWCAEGIAPEINNLQNIPLDDFVPEWIIAHKNGEAYIADDVSLLPQGGEFGLRAILQAQGIKSIITIPKIKNNELIGFVGFDYVKKNHQFSENEKNILFVFANMLVNIIQRKENEEFIKAQEQKKEELLNYLSIQNEELNDYAQAVSHDLKAPLINIHTLVNWFKVDHKDSLEDSAITSLNQILFNVEKMDLLIKGILDYSMIDKLESKERSVNINRVVSEVIKTMVIPEKVDITVQQNLPILYGNAHKFRQVFQNLIQNAVNYNDKEKGIIEVGFTEKNDHFEFFVKDNGIGIHPDYFQKIFKVFTKLESTSSSSGIGLSIVKKIIRSYKGAVWLESKEDVGTTFYFTILKE